MARLFFQVIKEIFGMSFAASTAPGAKQHFVASKRYGGLKKIITPKTRQWGNTDEQDLKQNFKPSNFKVNSVSKKQKGLSSQNGISSQIKSADKNSSALKSVNVTQTANEKKHVARHKHKHDTEKCFRPIRDDSDSATEFGNIGGKIVGNNIYITSVKKYKEMLFQRKHYVQRIEHLEADLKEVLALYEKLYKENETLKQKLNMHDQIVAESYKTVLNDRNILRAAEASYKKRISQLETDLKFKTKENSAIKEEIKHLKAENRRLYEDIKRLVGQLSASNTDQDIEINPNETFWENKPNKNEAQWLMKKKLQNAEKPKKP